MWASASVNSRGAAEACRGQAQQRRAAGHGEARRGHQPCPQQPATGHLSGHTQLGQQPAVTLGWCRANVLKGPSVALCVCLLTGDQSCHVSSVRFRDDQEMGQTQA